MKSVLLIAILLFSNMALASECLNDDSLMDLELSYSCQSNVDESVVCVNLGDFRFENKKVLRVFDPNKIGFDKAIFFENTNFSKCIWGIASCEAIKESDQRLEAKRRVIPIALLKASETIFVLNKDKKEALLTKAFFNDEGDQVSFESEEFQKCKKLK